MGHLDEHRRSLPPNWLQTALKAVRDDDVLAVPRPDVRERVMRDWDARRHRRRLAPRAFWVAAAASITLALAWSVAQSPSGERTGQAAAARAGEASDSEVVLAPEVLMDDASSFQYVRLSLTPRTMAALGIPVANPADDVPIAVEALIGLDGIPRSIRYAQYRQESQ